MAGLSLFLVAVVATAAWLALRESTYVAPDRKPGVASADEGGGARALADLTRAVRRGSPASASALGGDQHLLRGVVANARALHVEDFSLRYVDEAGAVDADGTWPAYVEAGWRFAGFDGRAVHLELRVTFTRSGQRVGIGAIGGGDRRSPLWLTGPLQVRRTPTTLVLVDGSAREADRYAALARTAVPQVQQVLPAWRGGLVLEVPGSAAGLRRELAADPDTYSDIAAVTTTVDGSTSRTAPVHVFVNPEVAAGLRRTGAQVVVTHEATHVAVGAATSTMAPWLLEGFADYVALREVRLPLTTTAAHIIADVRHGGAPHHLPGTGAFGTSARHLEATYESAWLACRLLAQRGGADALVRAYRAVDAGAPLGPTLERDLGLSEPQLTRQWRTLLTRLAT
ncbi:MAG: hypothetical protein ACR2K3_13505 [Nocardioides sp.]